MPFRFRSLPWVGALLVLALRSSALGQSMQLPVPVGMDGDPAARMVLAGNVAFLHGDLAGAAHAYRAALTHKRDFAIATFNLGLVEMHQGANAQGRLDMQRGISLAMQHGMSARDVARLRALRASFDEAGKTT